MRKVTFTRLVAILLLAVGTLTLQAQSWTKLPNSITDGIGDVYFLDASKGYIVAANNAYKTDNAGSTWTNMNVGVPTNVNLNAVFAAMDGSNYTIYVIGNIVSTTGDNPTIMKSTDDGATWTALTIPVTNAFMNSLYGFDANNIIMAGGESNNGGMILKTTDGGATWNKVNMNPDVAFFSAVSFGSATHGVAVGLEGTPFQSGTIYSTTDGGVTWTKGTEPATIMNTAYGLNGSSYYAGDGAGNVWLTFDQGATWTQTLTTPITTSIRDMTFPDPSEGYAVANGAVLIGTNGGQNWILDASFTGTESFFAIHVDVATGVRYVVGSNGAVYRYGQPVSIAEEKAIEFEMYPNPAINQVTVKAEAPITNIEVYDLLGRNVLTIETNLKEYKLDVSSLANGTYSIKVFTEEGNATQKLMKN